MISPSGAFHSRSLRAARASFLLALGLLLANDWFFKPTGILPGWLTGKLSDLAGMVVAPVVLAALLAMLGAGARGGAVAGAVLVGVIFAAIKLRADAARLYDDVISGACRLLSLPLTAHTVPDATDLVALPLLGPGALAGRALANDRSLRRGGGLLCGLLACAATSFSHGQVAPHWGFADDRLMELWARRVAGGALMVRLGRYSDDGRFEVELQVAAEEATIGLPLADVAFEVGATRALAQRPERTPVRLEVPSGSRAVARVFFVPEAGGWPPVTLARLRVPLERGGRREQVEVPFTLEERLLPWSEIRRRFSPR